MTSITTAVIPPSPPLSSVSLCLSRFSELTEISQSVLHGASAPSFTPPPSPPLQEEDQLGLVARSLKLPTVPDEIQLSSDNFDKHVSNYSKTVVVFCVKCEKLTVHQYRVHHGGGGGWGQVLPPTPTPSELVSLSCVRSCPPPQGFVFLLPPQQF